MSKANDGEIGEALDRYARKARRWLDKARGQIITKIGEGQPVLAADVNDLFEAQAMLELAQMFEEMGRSTTSARTVLEAMRSYAIRRLSETSHANTLTGCGRDNERRRVQGAFLVEMEDLL